jgi:hypothetical protein
MSKSVHDDVLDGALNIVKNNVTTMTMCSVAPTTRTEAITTYALADVAVGSSDVTAANGDTSGRKMTVAAKTGVTVDATGMGTHIALVDGTRLLFVTEANTVRQNTAQAGGASTITLDASASAVDSFYNNMAVTIVSGVGIGQTRYISGYVGSTKVATVGSAWSVTPDNTSVFRIYGQQLTAGGGNTIDFAAWDYELADPS